MTQLGGRSPAQYLIIAAIVLTGGLMCVATAHLANVTNGEDGFPLDDAWIHLQFAKNIHAFGSYSYFKNEMVTSGSTSPLYTLLLAAGFFITSHEMLLSYALGVAFLILAAAYLYKIASGMFDQRPAPAIAAALLFVCEPRLLWASLSGMETTLFIFLLLATFYYYRARKPVPCGIAGGLLLWARPEAILFVVIIGLDVAYHAFVVGDEGKKKRGAHADRFTWIRRPLAIIIPLWCAYAGFNLWLSGTIFPNTYAAKLKYYSHGGDDYPGQVFHYFTDGHMTVLAALVVIGVFSSLARATKRRPVPLLVPVLFGLEMFLVYWKDLPYLYQEGRYLMPVLPFVILVGTGGASMLAEVIAKRVPRLARADAARVILVAIPVLQFAVAGWNGRAQYAEYCAYISRRQVATAMWIRDHLPPDARIATHDVGAIAFYSGRRIVDMVGLISPEMIPRLGSLDALVQFLNSRGVTHLALLRNWFEIDNQNPLFSTDPDHPEIMEVFEYHPRNVHFLTRDVDQLFQAGQYYAAMNDITTAGRYFAQGVQRDPRSSKGHRLLGEAYARVGKFDDAAREFQAALQLHPGDVGAQTGLARIALQQHRTDDAIAILDGVIAGAPAYADAYRLLSQAFTAKNDTARGAMYARKADELARAPGP